MNPFAKLAIPLIGLAFLSPNASLAQERDRSKIPDQYKWNLTDIYSSDAAWKEAKEKLFKDLPAVEKYKGKLGTSPAQLLGCLSSVTDMAKEFSRLFSYASLSLDQDTREQSYLAMQGEMGQMGAEFGAKIAFIEPEILKISPDKIKKFLKSEKKLEIYRHYLDDILRRKAHTGTEGEEKIIADAGLMSDAPESIYSIFANADFPYPEITLSDGKTVKLNQSGYSLHRASINREDRKKVFSAFMGKLNDYRRTYGTQLNAQIKKDLFYKKARNYKSCLENALDRNNIPTEVYHSLIDNVNKNLSTFHRYLKLRQRILGVDQLHYYDLYAPLLANVDLNYTIEEAENISLQLFSRWAMIIPAL